MLSLLLPTLLAAAPALAQSPAGLLDPGVRDLLHEELSGELAKEHVIAITRHHRIQGSRGYRDAAHYVLGQLRSYGFGEQGSGGAEAWIESYPSDGKLVYQTWQSPSGWDIESAELRMLEPVEERICGFPEIAMSVVTYSNPGDVTAELVWVGAGTREADYASKDVRGKFVLATGYGGAVHRLAVLEHGAAAVVCYLDDARAAEHPDMLAYTGMWPKTDELERTTFGFNLSNRQGERLRGLLERGRKVVLRGTVRGTGLEPYFMDVVVARIPGGRAADEELVFSAHLDHPKESANDNASGSGAILDVARGLQRLIADGRLPQPERSLRFLWVPEWNGTMAYIDAHLEFRGPGLGGKVLANMNLDMVGEHLELLHSRLILTRTPSSLPSVLNDVVEDMAAMVDRMDVRTPRGSLSAFNYRVTPYSGGSDHMMMLDRKIPAVMFSHSPDYTHHTSEDTPDKVDPVQLERCEIIAAGSLWYLANLDAEQATELLHRAAASGAEQFTLAAGRARRMIAAEGADEQSFAEAMSLLAIAAQGQKQRLRSVLGFARTPTLAREVQHREGSVDQLMQSEVVAAQAWAREAREELAGLAGRAQPGAQDLRVPVRTTRGPLAFDLPESRLPEERGAWYRGPGSVLDGDRRFELVNFMDGARTVSQIRDFLAAGFGPLPLPVVARFVEDLVAVGVAEWKP